MYNILKHWFRKLPARKKRRGEDLIMKRMTERAKKTIDNLTLQQKIQLGLIHPKKYNTYKW